MITGVISGLVVVFVAWMAKQLFLSRRLFLIAPKLFDYSDLVSRNAAKTIELTLFNGGSRAEEDVRVQLSPAFGYTVIASDRPGMSVDNDGFLKIDRLAPKQELTVIMTAEGGEFRKEHVVEISSKETVGKIKEGLQEAQLTPAQNFLVFFAFVVLMPLLGYVAGRFVENEFLPVMFPDGVFSEKVVLAYDLKAGSASSSLEVQKGAMNKMLETFRVEKMWREGDGVIIDIKIENDTDRRLTYTFITTTQVSERRSEFPGRYDFIQHDVIAFPGTSKSVRLSDYLPGDESFQVILLKATVEGDSGSAYRTDEITVK